MPAAPVLPDEPFRLEALHRLRVLDTAAETAFDRIVLLAKAVTRAETVLVSLTDADRQWFKAKSGIEVAEVPRDVAFCAHAILSPHVTWVEDARLDTRFADNPLVQGPPFVRFYAGAPIKLAADLRVGTVCALDPEPRSHDPLIDAAMRRLADIAGEQLTARLASLGGPLG